MDLDRLCSQCEAANPVALFEGIRSEEGTDYQAVNARTKRLKTLSDLRGSQQCPFCRLVLHAIDTTLEGGLLRPLPQARLDPETVFCVLRPCRADLRDSYSFDDPETRLAVATLLEVGLEASEGEDEERARLVAAWMPWTSIKLCFSSAVPSRPLLNARDPEERNGDLRDVISWLQECETCHSACALSSSAYAGRVADVPFYLIDVNSSELIQADTGDPNLGFAALSYVWGQSSLAYATISAAQSRSVADTSRLPEKIPKTIEDAMQICRELGMQYLWVDLYCIEQGNRMIRASQVDAMDTVFSRARFVLVAAQGEHADIGMSRHGTHSAVMYPPKFEVVQGRKLATTPPNYTLSIGDSPWAQRAWTFQEGLLARRCIVFDGCDIWFFCRSFQKRQTDHWPVNVPLTQPGHIRSRRSVPFMGCIPEAGQWIFASSWSFNEYDKLLRTYSTRSMTRDDDATNALAGCLSLMSTSHSVPFQYGLPVRDFVFALLWDRYWYDERRGDFPSWSWAGWHSFQHGHIWRPICHNESTKSHDIRRPVCTGAPIPKLEGDAGMLAGKLEFELNGDWFRIDDTEDDGKTWSVKWPAMRVEEACDEARDRPMLCITSSMIRFRMALRPGENSIVFAYPAHVATTKGTESIPTDFDSEISCIGKIQEAVMYSTPYERIELRDHNGHVRKLQHPGTLSSFKLNLPIKISGHSLRRLLEQDVHLVRILDLDKVSTEHDRSKQRVHYVSCLIVRQDEGYWERFGSALMPLSVWEASAPQACDISIA